MGTFKDEERATALCDRIRAACEEQYADLENDSPGYAYVLPVEQPRVRAALRWALRGER